MSHTLQLISTSDASSRRQFYSIASFVIALHALLLGWALLLVSHPHEVVKRTRLRVQTVAVTNSSLVRAMPLESAPTNASVVSTMPLTLKSGEDDFKKAVMPAKTVQKVEAAPSEPPNLVARKPPAPTNPAPQKNTPALVPKKAQPAVVKITPKAPAKKVISKEIPKSKPAPIPAKAASVPAKAAPVQSQAAIARKKTLLAAAQNSIGKISAAPSKMAIAAAAAAADLKPSFGKLSDMHVDSIGAAGHGSGETLYSDELANRLRLLLRLPQYGEVDIELSIDRSGKVVKLRIIKSENSANRAHIEKALASMRFPGFGTNFVGEEQHTFRIKLSNDIKS